MAINVGRLKEWAFGEVEHRYTERESALYALCLGFGADPLDERALRYVAGDALRAAPFMAAVLAFPGQWMRDPRSGIDWKRVVHGEQGVRLHRPLAATGCLVGRTRVSAVIDKGREKGAVVQMERSLYDMTSGDLLATVEQLNFCRGDGGFSEDGQPSDASPPSMAWAPSCAPDDICDLPTRPETALLYRLCGDPNPLHFDPAVARSAGFARPILHGLATYGIAGHAVLRTACGYDAGRLRSLHARFSAPVYPGETLRTELWRDGPWVRFRCRVLERDQLVLTAGRAELVPTTDRSVHQN
ncbi:(3R)-hydroxyacyl-ACP dehydratase subunit HadB [Variovorax sp. PBS-H4]|uniref:MaoC/PaaZ C-terminal domain-containing protein n=1 Tax=Variovorax sp. PBS-H4 TaxID=434008 RepID=UPI001319B314|nr:MaoC/PaaZ C-terminal domain-containing protein [Variovorax sp. PBS-H4]VTU25467.1 (3R)-hydroxyacyl-ACP dehydratase subunit HadB [Variovorax sp. PBS-H4]